MTVDKKVSNPKSEEYEAASRIIQRLTAVGIIHAESLTEKQRNIILELCGLERLKTYQ